MGSSQSKSKQKKHKSISIQQYIVFTFISLVLVPTLLAFSLIIRQYSQHTVEQIVAQKVDLIEAIYQNINAQLQNFQDMTMMLYYDSAVMESLAQPNADPKQSAACYRFLSAMVNSEKYLSAAVITAPGGTCTAGQTYQDFDAFVAAHQQAIYAAKGRPVWLPTYNFSTTYGMKTQAFVLARAINSPTQEVGILWLFISENFLYHNLKEFYKDEASQLYVTSPEDLIVAGTDRNTVTGILSLGELATAQQEQHPPATVYETKGANGQMLIVREMPKTGWRLLETTPTSVVYGQLRNVQRLGIIVFGMYLLFIVVTYLILRYMVFDPLRNLRKGLLMVSRGDFTRTMQKKHNDEIGDLTDSYDTMLRKIDELIGAVRIEEQAKTEQKIKVLAMQIGPHFVYNTLNSIKWLAAINNQTNIKCMVESLIKLMMSVTYNTNEEIPLRDELQLLESYCYIQKARYMNFELVCDVPPALLDYKVNKLILQPLVENSILYGFCKSGRQGTVVIHGEATADALLLTVADDGMGFDISNLQDILQKEQSDSQHIGLKNVNDRIRLCHGEPYGLALESEVGGGTRVMLRLPLLQ